MSKVLLVDFDSRIPNLALMKISAWSKLRGHDARFVIEDPDHVVVSVIFSKNRSQAAGLTRIFPNAQIHFGGPGWDLKNFLPPSIEKIKPDYDLYPSEFSQGFTSRGCIRHCPFCVVPEKEGKIQVWQHPSKFHDDQFNTCMIMDNNLLALPDWFKTVASWFIENGIKMKSPQGWDARLLTEEYAGILKDIRHEGVLHFAWDHTKDEEEIVRAIRILKDAGFDLKHKIGFYVLAGYGEKGYNPTFEDALYRCNRLREIGTNAFVMPYHKKDRRINKLAKWADRSWSYWSKPYPMPEQFVKARITEPIGKTSGCEQ